jgi:hypothetical protein
MPDENLIRNLEARVKSEKQRAKTGPKLKEIADFYWQDSKPSSWGQGAVPAIGRSLLSQLLVTPTLIVDMVPPTDNTIEQLYGVTVEQ